MRVTGLRVYPVKSLGGQSVDQASVEPQGLAGDRRWCLVDGAGEVVTARECHALLRLTAEVVDQHSIRLTDRADGAIMVVPVPRGDRAVPISLSQLACATPGDAEASAWISQRMGRPLRLVWQEDPAARPVSAAHGGQSGDVVSMADTGPLLLVSESSLSQLNQWIGEHPEPPTPPGPNADAPQDDAPRRSAEPLDVVRFRPNVVLDGAQPFAEDAWTHVQIGAVTFRTSERCDRCVMTTIDPLTLVRGKEPIRTLARHRRWDGASWFGIRLVPLGVGTLRVGDTVTLVGGPREG